MKTKWWILVKEAKIMINNQIVKIQLMRKLVLLRLCTNYKICNIIFVNLFEFYFRRDISRFSQLKIKAILGHRLKHIILYYHCICLHFNKLKGRLSPHIFNFPNASMPIDLQGCRYRVTVFCVQILFQNLFKEYRYIFCVSIANIMLSFNVWIGVETLRKLLLQQRRNKKEHFQVRSYDKFTNFYIKLVLLLKIVEHISQMLSISFD